MRSGKLTTIIYIRTTNKKGQEVSGYLDYAQRLRADNFEKYFDEVCFYCRLPGSPIPVLLRASIEHDISLLCWHLRFLLLLGAGLGTAKAPAKDFGPELLQL